MIPRTPHRWLAVTQRRDRRLAIYCNHPADCCDWNTGVFDASRWPVAVRAGLAHIKEHR